MSGVQQPGGAGTPITIDDDSVVADGYPFDAIKTAFPADFVQVGALEYEAKVDVQIGDGTSTAKTTLKDSGGKRVRWINGKTLKVSAVGRANHWIEMGTKFAGVGNVLGYNGCELQFGAQTTLIGNSKFYGTTLKALQAGAAGRIILTPGEPNLVAECVDVNMETVDLTNLGNAAGAMSLIRRMNCVMTGSGGRMTQFNCADADGMVIYGHASQTAKINTGGTVIGKRFRFVGPSAGGDIRCTFQGHLLDTTWSQQCLKHSVVVSYEWQSLNVYVSQDSAGLVPAANCLVEGYDGLGRLIVNARTDSDGVLAFTPPGDPVDGLAPFTNAVILTGRVTPTGGRIYFGPYVFYFNRDQALPFPVVTSRVSWPYSATWSVTEKQYEPMTLVVTLAAPAATAPAPYMDADYLPDMLAEVGEDVSVGVDITKGIVNRRGVEIAPEGEEGSVVIATEESVVIQTGTLPGLFIGVQVGLGGVTYRAADVRQKDDGALTVIMLARE